MTNPTFVINERIKELDKTIRRAKREWHKCSDKSSKLKKESPRYGNEFDYSTEYNCDVLDQLKKLEYKRMSRIKIQITCQDEKKYLRSILKRTKDKKFTIYPFSRYE